MEALKALRIIKDDTDGRPVSPGSASGTPSRIIPPRTQGDKENGAATTSRGGSGGGGGGGEDAVTVSVYDDPTTPAGSGGRLARIQFSVKYNDSTLTLKIMRAVDLPVMDYMTGTSDPYVKVMLLPDKKSKLSTSIKRKNLNPRWNEIFEFEGFSQSKLVNRTLYMQVLDYDRFSRDDPMGEVCVPLGEIDLSQSQTIWRNLQPCKGHAGKLGELLLSLCYQTNVGTIAVEVTEARGLRAMDINGLSDPYVKIWLMHDGKKVEKKKTAIHQKTLNPVFEETFVFSVPYERIRQTSLVVSVMDYDKVGRNDKIGQIILGSKSGAMEVKHWNEMFAKSRTQVAKWHILKDFD